MTPCGATLEQHDGHVDVCELEAGHYDGPPPGAAFPFPETESWHRNRYRTWLDAANGAAASPVTVPAEHRPNRAGYSAGRVCYPTGKDAALGDARTQPEILGVAWWPDRGVWADLNRRLEVSR